VQELIPLVGKKQPCKVQILTHIIDPVE
jgi:hypothetical protein